MGDLDELFDGNDATGLAVAISGGEVSAREMVEIALQRIEERNPILNAVVEQRAEAALAEASSGLTGPLAGVPFVVKDLGVDVAGMHSTSGSRLRADVVATADSTLIERYRTAGLIIVGTTNTPEFGRNASTEPMVAGPTRNPYLLSHSVGGSSGGTAAAVASGMVPAGHGNDGGGSIRIPASACGLVGLKPTRGRTPTYPRRSSFAYPVSINHALTRTVRDSALLLDITSGPVVGDPFMAPAPARPYVDEVGAPTGRCRVAFSTVTQAGKSAAPELIAVTQEMANLLESLGHIVEEATPDYPVDALQKATGLIMSVPLAAEIHARLSELGRDLRDDDLEPFTHIVYQMGLAATGIELADALSELERAGHVLGPFFERYDVLLTPTMPVPPPPLGLLDTTNVESIYSNAGQYASLTSFCNVTGQPAISLPGGHDGDGLPLGVQLAAAFGREDLLIRLASQLEQARPWSTAPAWPPVAAG